MIDFAQMARIADGEEDPITAESQAEAQASRLLELDVATELHKIKVRDIAAARRRQEADADRTPFDSGLLDEILRQPPEPPARIQGAQQWKSNTILVAPNKTGKSTMMTNYAYALITGKPFLNYFPVIQVTGRVAVLNFEVSQQTMARWFDDRSVPLDRVYMASFAGRRNPFNNPDDRKRLRDQIVGYGCETLVVDPFSRAGGGINQDNNSEVEAFLQDLELFARDECGVNDLLLTVHAGWNGERSRGASTLEGWPTDIWNMNRTSFTSPRTFSAFGRGSGYPAPGVLDFDPQTKEYTFMSNEDNGLATASAKFGEATAKALSLVAAQPGITKTELRKAMGIASAEATAAVKYLVDDGQLVIKPGANRAQHYYLQGPDLGV